MINIKLRHYFIYFNKIKNQVIKKKRQSEPLKYNIAKVKLHIIFIDNLLYEF